MDKTIMGLIVGSFLIAGGSYSQTGVSGWTSRDGEKCSREFDMRGGTVGCIKAPPPSYISSEYCEQHLPQYGLDKEDHQAQEKVCNYISNSSTTWAYKILSSFSFTPQENALYVVCYQKACQSGTCFTGPFKSSNDPVICGLKDCYNNTGIKLDTMAIQIAIAQASTLGKEDSSEAPRFESHDEYNKDFYMGQNLNNSGLLWVNFDMPCS